MRGFSVLKAGCPSYPCKLCQQDYLVKMHTDLDFVAKALGKDTIIVGSINFGKGIFLWSDRWPQRLVPCLFLVAWLTSWDTFNHFTYPTMKPYEQYIALDPRDHRSPKVSGVLPRCSRPEDFSSFIYFTNRPAHKRAQTHAQPWCPIYLDMQSIYRGNLYCSGWIVAVNPYSS